MKVINKAHHYELINVEKGSQKLLFINKEIIDIDGEPKLRTVHDGTTNEEVLEVLIDRIETLNKRVPSKYNDVAIQYLKNAHQALLARTADRENRKVEGTHKV